MIEYNEAKRSSYLQWQNASFRAKLAEGNRHKRRRNTKLKKQNGCGRCGILIRPPAQADHYCEDCGQRI